MRHALSSATKRALALAGAATLGTLAALGPGAPAFAHHATLTSTVECTPGKPGMVNVTFAIANSERDLVATVVTAKTPFGAIDVGATVPKKGTSLVVTQTLPQSAGTAAVDVKLQWDRKNGPKSAEVKGSVTFGDLPCGPAPQPAAAEVTASASCDGKTLLIKNPAGNPNITAKVTVGGVVKDIVVAGGATESVKLALDTLTADVHIGETHTIVSFDRLEPCPGEGGGSPAPSTPVGTPGGGGTLPVTGDNGPLLAGGAAGLIALGGGLFWLARRRRIQFAA